VPDVAGRMEAGYVAPRTPTEEVLARIWAEVLDIQNVGVTEDFFEVGGHSIVAVSIIARIRDTFEIELTITDLFQTLTVANLAKTVDEAVAEAASFASMGRAVAAN
jgi:acyl carrier protein